MQHLQPAIVCDAGGGYCKAGIAGESAPRTRFSTLSCESHVKQHKYNWCNTPQLCKTYIAEEAMARRHEFPLKTTFQHGVVIDWNRMERIWQHAFSCQLGVRSEEHPVMLTERALNHMANREKAIQIMFETFQTPAAYLAIQPLLSLYASGRVSGIVVESGEDVTQITPIHEGYVLPHAWENLYIGGSDLTRHLTTLLNTEHGRRQTFSTSSSAEREIIRDMKEKLGYVALDYEDELIETKHLHADDAGGGEQFDRRYELPDGNLIKLSSAEQFSCTEPLFNPALIGRDFKGIHNTMYTMINKIDVELHRQMYSNIVLSGGSMMFAGIDARIEKEMKALAPQSMKIKIMSPTSSAPRSYSAWLGGSILASISAFESQWIRLDEYDENGPQLVHRKCF